MTSATVGIEQICIESEEDKDESGEVDFSDYRCCRIFLLTSCFIPIFTGFLLLSICPTGSNGPIAPVVVGLMYLIVFYPRIIRQYYKRNTSYREYISTVLLVITVVGIYIAGFKLSVGALTDDPRCSLGHVMFTLYFLIPVGISLGFLVIVCLMAQL